MLTIGQIEMWGEARSGFGIDAARAPECRPLCGPSEIDSGMPMLRIASRKRGYEIRYAFG